MFPPAHTAAMLENPISESTQPNTLNKHDPRTQAPLRGNSPSNRSLYSRDAFALLTGKTPEEEPICDSLQTF